MLDETILPNPFKPTPARDLSAVLEAIERDLVRYHDRALPAVIDDAFVERLEEIVAAQDTAHRHRGRQIVAALRSRLDRKREEDVA